MEENPNTIAVTFVDASAAQPAAPEPAAEAAPDTKIKAEKGAASVN
jgi:hypothetical protein